MKREIIFKIDGSLYGILTAVYETFSKKLNQQNVDLRCQTDLIKQNLFNETIIIETNKEKATKVLKKLKFLLNNGNYNRLFIAVKSGRENACQIIFSYILKIIKENKDVSDNFNDESVFLYNKMINAILLESHRFKGFLRFSKLENGVYYAKYSPDNDVTELITPHFVKRFFNMPFIIHDEKRGVLSAHASGKTVYKNSNVKALNVKDEFSNLFKTYCDAVFIKQRKNTRLMLNYMPKRYHKNTPEKDELLNC